MGAGRKTFTYDADTRGQEAFTIQNFEASQRNLGEDLGGCIFGCTHETYDECVNNLIFGLPRAHWCYVQNIKKGMPIFLFNYQSRKLHGIFRAVSDGDWKINPHGWVGHTNRETQYPSQVRVEVYSKCPPLDKGEYDPIIKNCYYPEGSGHRNKMMFELKKVEAQNLCRAFDRAAGHVNATTRPQPVPRSLPPPGVADRAAASSSAAAGPSAAPPASNAGAAAVPRIAAASAGAAAAAADGGGAMANGIAAGGWDGVAGAKKPKPNVWGAKAEQAPEPVNNGASSSSGPVAAKEPAAPSTPPATPKAPSSEPVFTNGNAASTAPNSAACSAPPPGPTVPSAHPSGVAGVATDIDGKITAVHTALSAVDTAAADALWHCLSSVTNQMQIMSRENAMLMHGMRSLKLENSLLKNEVASLRRDTSRVGQAVNVQISAESPALENMPPTFMGKKIEDIYLLGGHNGMTWLDSMHLYTPAYRSIQPVCTMPFARGYGGVAVVGRSIYVVGGGDGASWLQTAMRYDIDTKDWFQIADMEMRRGSLAVAALDGLVYAMGGGQPGVNHSSIEVFTPATNTWAPGPSMFANRFTTAGAALGSAIYMTGGFDGAQYLNSVEMLDPRTGTWHMMAPMAHKRGSHVCTVVGHELFAIGGWDAKDYLSGVEIYDARANAWRAAKPMSAPRAYGAAATVDGAVFTLGGMQSQVHNETVERYDAANDVWVMETIPVPEAVKRAFLSACVVDAY
ncbi:probable Kelch-like protein 17 at C-terminar half [Coccomyxa sp. Obi]|nr:probable Kelch-like protein 17 at C-terminar half [Coccomyxa sp. Obi]